MDNKSLFKNTAYVLSNTSGVLYVLNTTNIFPTGIFFAFLMISESARIRDIPATRGPSRADCAPERVHMGRDEGASDGLGPDTLRGIRGLGIERPSSDFLTVAPPPSNH